MLWTASGPIPSSRHRSSVTPTPAQVDAHRLARLYSLSETDCHTIQPEDTNEKSYISTMHALVNFDSKTSTDETPEQRKSKSDRRKAYWATREQQRKLLNQLTRLQNYQNLNPRDSLRDWVSHGFRKPAIPREEDVIDLAHWYFPPRMALKVQVCDIGVDKTHRFETHLGNIEACRLFKPMGIMLLV